MPLNSLDSRVVDGLKNYFGSEDNIPHQVVDRLLAIDQIVQRMSPRGVLTSEGRLRSNQVAALVVHDWERTRLKE